MILEYFWILRLELSDILVGGQVINKKGECNILLPHGLHMFHHDVIQHWTCLQLIMNRELSLEPNMKALWRF